MSFYSCTYIIRDANHERVVPQVKRLHVLGQVADHTVHVVRHGSVHLAQALDVGACLLDEIELGEPVCRHFVGVSSGAARSA